MESLEEAIRALKALNADLDVIDKLRGMTDGDYVITSRFVEGHPRLDQANEIQKLTYALNREIQRLSEHRGFGTDDTHLRVLDGFLRGTRHPVGWIQTRHRGELSAGRVRDLLHGGGSSYLPMFIRPSGAEPRRRRRSSRGVCSGLTERL